MPIVPAWASSMGFCHAGCYVYATQDALAKACNMLTRKVAYNEPAYLEVVRQPLNMEGYREFFRTLEMMDVNLMAEADEMNLVCYGATMTQTRQGHTVLNGRFQVQALFSGTIPKVEINLRASLVVSRESGTHSTVSTSGVVGFFTVPCKITMDPDDFNRHWASFAAVDNPLFGFFEHVKEPQAEVAVSSSTGFVKKLSSARKSLSNTLALSKS